MKRGTELICEGRHTVVDDYNPSTGEVLLLFEDGSEEWVHWRRLSEIARFPRRLRRPGPMGQTRHQRATRRER